MSFSTMPCKSFMSFGTIYYVVLSNIMLLYPGNYYTALRTHTELLITVYLHWTFYYAYKNSTHKLCLIYSAMSPTRAIGTRRPCNFTSTIEVVVLHRILSTLQGNIRLILDKSPLTWKGLVKDIYSRRCIGKALWVMRDLHTARRCGPRPWAKWRSSRQTGCPHLGAWRLHRPC